MSAGPALSPGNVIVARVEFRDGATLSDLSERFDCSTPTIRAALKGTGAYDNLRLDEPPLTEREYRRRASQNVFDAGARSESDKNVTKSWY